MMTYYGSTTATTDDNTDGRNTPLLMQQQSDQIFGSHYSRNPENKSLEGVVSSLNILEKKGLVHETIECVVGVKETSNGSAVRGGVFTTIFNRK